MHMYMQCPQHGDSRGIQLYRSIILKKCCWNKVSVRVRRWQQTRPLSCKTPQRHFPEMLNKYIHIQMETKGTPKATDTLILNNPLLQ